MNQHPRRRHTLHRSANLALVLAVVSVACTSHRDASENTATARSGVATTLHPSGSFSTDGTPTFGLGVGDFNRDGRQDVVVTVTNGVALLINDGEGHFGPPSGAPPSFPTATNTNSLITLAVADFNGDTNLDVVTSNGDANNVSILLGNGDGTFAAHTEVSTANEPTSVIAVDVNNDGHMDIVTTHGGMASKVGVLLGNGNGTFSAQVLYPTGHRFVTDLTPDNFPAYAVASGLLNGDAYPDLVTANSDDNTISVLLNNGDGTFGADSTFAVGTHPKAVAVGDFNKDGHPDIAVANLQSDTVSVLLGNGSGGFGGTSSFAVNIKPNGIAVGDFNGDGNPDIVASSYFDDGSSGGAVSVLLGDGTGSFAAYEQAPAAQYGIAVAVGSFNGDTKEDVLATGFYGRVSALRSLLSNGLTVTPADA